MHYEFCEIVFGEGPLGLRIYSEDGNPPVKIKSFYSTTTDNEPSRAQRCGLLNRDDIITKIGKLDVSKLSYEDVLRQIIKSKRPVSFIYIYYFLIMCIHTLLNHRYSYDSLEKMQDRLKYLNEQILRK
jgi:hypothetical protein